MAHPYLENSIILSKLMPAYEASSTLKFSHILGNWCKGCFLYKIYRRVMEKKPIYSFSIVFKAARFVAVKTDRLAGLVHDKFSAAVDTSMVGRLFKELAAEGTASPCRMLAAALLSFAAGYFLVVAIKGLWTGRNLLIIFAFLLLGLLLAAIGSRWKAWLSNSAVARIFRYIAD